MRSGIKGGVLAALAATVAVEPAGAIITATSDPILYWNERMTTLYTAPPPVQSRAYAMANIAMHDAVNAVLGGPDRSYLSGVGTAAGGDTRAAASQAAHDVMVALNPANAAQYGAALNASLAMVADGGAKTQGRATGAAYAAAILAARANDGSGNPLGITYATTGQPGDWRPTSAGNPVLPFWGDVTPFVMSAGDQFRAGPPPALTSADYAAAYNEVKEIGSANSQTRTADQTASALFWDQANAAPWLQIGLLVAEDEGFSTIALASAFGRLSTGLADALIAGFDTKYEYRLWRPITAIREGDTDGNAATVGDAAWNSLFPAPLHPSYIGTHSALSGAGYSILSGIFGDDEGFTLTIAGDTRSFTSLLDAEQDGANSRLWGGIHFRFDNERGLVMGEQVGRLSLSQSAFGAVPEPATWTMMLVGMGVAGGFIRRRNRVAAA